MKVVRARLYPNLYRRRQGQNNSIFRACIKICVAMNMIKISDVKEALLNKPENLEIVLTGRYAHPELKALAHLVTEMKPIKHYFDCGVMARQGIEY